MKYLAGCVLLLTSALGCSINRGSMPNFSQSATQLERANFRIIRANARVWIEGFLYSASFRSCRLASRMRTTSFF